MAAGLVCSCGTAALGCAAGAGAAGFAGAGAETAAPSASITPTTVFTCTVVPSATFTSFSTPLAGAGISASTLSVEISNSGSSRVTLSPGFFSHLVSVPSKIDSPIWGMMTSVGMSILSARRQPERNLPFYRTRLQALTLGRYD